MLRIFRAVLVWPEQVFKKTEKEKGIMENATALAKPSWLPSKNPRVARLFTAPIFDALAGLIRTASKLWHPWAHEKIKHLKSTATGLTDWARESRRYGLQTLHLGGENSRAAVILAAQAFRRNYSGSEEKNKRKREFRQDTVAAEICLHIAIGLMEQTIAKMDAAAENRMHDFMAEDSKRLQKIWEPLSDILAAGTRECFPGGDPKSAVLAIERSSLLFECEGLAHMQAQIEDASRKEFSTRQPTRKRKPLSAEEISRLADDIDYSPEILKEVLEAEYSSWWDVSHKFGKEAIRSATETFTPMQIPSGMREAITAELYFGYCYNDNSPYISDPKESFETCSGITALIRKYSDAAKSEIVF